MPTYRMVYGDDNQVVRETFENVEVEREDGWVVLFRGPEAIQRMFRVTATEERFLTISEPEALQVPAGEYA